MRRASIGSVVVAATGIALFALGLALDPTRACFAYLFAYVFGVSVAFGALALVMVGNASRSGWFVVVRRLAEGAMAAMPLFVLLFLPIALGARRLYPWAAPLEQMEPALREHVEAKRAYLNLPAFLVRAAIELGACALVAELLRRWSLKNRRERLQRLSGGALPFVGLAMTFASFDWVMSLEPDWYSDMYGFYFMIGGFTGAVALLALLVAVAHAAKPFAQAIGPDHTHAIGRVLFASVVLWAYIAFGQFLIIWIADIPEEIAWYAARTRGGWTPVTYALVIGHFIVPFFALLSRDLKRRPALLAVIGGWVLALHLVDMYWLVLPAYERAGLHVSWIDLGALLAVCGTATAFALVRASSTPLIPSRDPLLAEGLHYEASL